MQVLTSFSLQFEHPKTFGNYLGHIRLVCDLLKLDTAVFDLRAVKRAKQAIKKRGLFVPRPKRFIYHDIVVEMMDLVEGIAPVRHVSRTGLLVAAGRSTLLHSTRMASGRTFHLG